MFSPSQLQKLKKIRCLVCDVDGVMTTGATYMGDDGHEYRNFHFHDGVGLKMLRNTGVQVAVISTSDSNIVKRRMSTLEIAHVYLGHFEKLPAYEALLSQLSLDEEAIAVVGDDLPDLPMIVRAGFGIAVANANRHVKEHADYVTRIRGGYGAVREVCDLIMTAQGTLQQFLDKAKVNCVTQ